MKPKGGGAKRNPKIKSNGEILSFDKLRTGSAKEVSQNDIAVVFFAHRKVVSLLALRQERKVAVTYSSEGR